MIERDRWADPNDRGPAPERMIGAVRNILAGTALPAPFTALAARRGYGDHARLRQILHDLEASGHVTLNRADAMLAFNPTPPEPAR